MYQCHNCGGKLQFDIISQQLLCSSCSTYFDPYSVQEELQVETHKYMDTTVYCCSQCGAEIFSTENSVAEFCSFCGASSILESRMQQQNKPNYLIPFKKTKEDCINAYVKKIKRFFFSPRSLRDPAQLERFRPIYMPYWAYYVTQQGPVTLPGKIVNRSGDYIYTRHYNCNFSLDAAYKGLSYDASSSFSDNISQGIAPFNVHEMKNFTSAFLSGFYADMADIHPSTYKNDVNQFTKAATLEKINDYPAFSKYNVDTVNVSNQTLNLLNENTEKVLYPVWFLAYRNKDRISYATMNGQTGKIAADLPIDIKKFIIFSLILAVPIILLLNIFFTFTPTVVMSISGVFAVITAFVYASETRLINRRECNADDVGFLSRKPKSKAKEITDCKVKKHRNGWGLYIPLLLTVLVCIIYLISPASDLYYYITAFATYGGILFSLMCVIKRYNLLTSVPLPQFNKRGGEEYGDK